MTQSSEDLAFASVEELEAALRARDWPTIVLTIPDAEGNPQATDFVLLICPYCGGTVAPDSDQITSRDQHIRHHVAELTRVVLASGGIGFGVTLG